MQSQIIDSNTNKTHSFYPIINGIPLSSLTRYLKKLTPSEQNILSRVIIKNLLEAVANLHKIQIVHNNINHNNIIIDFGKSSTPLSVKLINFDMSCGKYWANKSYLYKG